MNSSIWNDDGLMLIAENPNPLPLFPLQIPRELV